MNEDPEEWTNLAARDEHLAILKQHRKWVPRVNLKAAKGSRDRILTYDPVSGVANWEGDDILPHAPIPEIDN